MDNKLNFTPFHNGILVNMEVKEKTESGIILPESQREQLDFTYEVVAVGPGCTQIKVGDWVLLKANGVKLHIEGDDYGFINEHQVYGTFPSRPDNTEAKKSIDSNLKLDKTVENIKDFNKRKGL